MFQRACIVFFFFFSHGQDTILSLKSPWRVEVSTGTKALRLNERWSLKQCVRPQWEMALSGPSQAENGIIALPKPHRFPLYLLPPWKGRPALSFKWFLRFQGWGGRERRVGGCSPFPSHHHPPPGCLPPALRFLGLIRGLGTWGENRFSDPYQPLPCIRMYLKRK